MVILTVTDSNGKKGYATVVIIVTDKEIPQVAQITVNANPESNVPGGTSVIQALVLDSAGHPVADGTTVYFITNSGTLSAPSATTTNGIAEVNLTLDNNMVSGEKARVTAFIGDKSGFVEITCIDVIVTIFSNISSILPWSPGTANISVGVTKTNGEAIKDVIVIFFSSEGSFAEPMKLTNVYGAATSVLKIPRGPFGRDITIWAKVGSRVSKEIIIERKWF
jgi:hypothetical protein